MKKGKKERKGTMEHHGKGITHKKSYKSAPRKGSDIKRARTGKGNN
jgi:hypothetical protein